MHRMAAVGMPRMLVTKQPLARYTPVAEIDGKMHP